MAAVRRIPCYCPACREQLNKPWKFDSAKKKSAPLEEQPKFQPAEDCIFAPYMGDLNKWYFVKVGERKGQSNESEINKIYQAALTTTEEDMRMEVTEDAYGAINCQDDEKGGPDGFYMVQWRGEPYRLEKDTVVEGMDGDALEAGSWVCEGRYLDPLPGCGGWFSKGGRKNKTRLFWMQHVLSGNVEINRYSMDGTQPKNQRWRKAYTGNKPERDLLYLDDEEVESILLEKERRDKLDLYEEPMEDEDEEEIDELNEGNPNDELVESLMEE